MESSSIMDCPVLVGAGCRLQSTGMQDTGCRVQDTSYKMPPPVPQLGFGEGGPILNEKTSDFRGLRPADYGLK